MSDPIASTPEQSTAQPAGPLRLLPSVAFAARAAALARVSLPVAMLAVSVAAGGLGVGDLGAGPLGAGGLGAGAEDLSLLNTTCCPPAHS